MGKICLCRRNFIGGFHGASAIFLSPRKTTVRNFSWEGQNGAFIASSGTFRVHFDDGDEDPRVPEFRRR